MVANTTTIFSLAAKNSGFRFLYDLDLKSKVKTNISCAESHKQSQLTSKIIQLLSVIFSKIKFDG